MGKTVPAFLFPDIKLANQSRDQQKFIPFGLNEAAIEVRNEIISAEQFNEQGFVDDTGVGSNALGNTTNLKVASPSTTLGTTNVDSATKPVVKQIVPKEDKPEPVVSDMPMGSKPLDVSDKEIDEIINYQGESGNPYLDQFTDSKKGITTPFDKVVAKNIQDPSDIGKQQQIIKAVEDRQAEREQNQAKVKEETKKETFQQKINRRGGFKAGGIASKKPKKKKVMKRGGLASKK